MNQKLLETIGKFLFSFFSKNGPEISVTIPIPMELPPEPKKAVGPEVDWNNPASKICKHFSVKEATYLNSWQVSHIPSDDQKAAICSIALQMDKVCDLLEKELAKPVQINVHAWIRPDPANCPGTKWNGQDYNKWIYWNQVWVGLTDAQKAEKHVPLSPHRTGQAVDFHVIGFEGPEGCAKIREMLLPHLEELGLRMEDLNGGWVHLDNLPVVHERFFKP